jgi:hypothetical protein
VSIHGLFCNDLGYLPIASSLSTKLAFSAPRPAG